MYSKYRTPQRSDRCERIEIFLRVAIRDAHTAIRLQMNNWVNWSIVLCNMNEPTQQHIPKQTDKIKTTKIVYPQIYSYTLKAVKKLGILNVKTLMIEFASKRIPPQSS